MNLDIAFQIVLYLVILVRFVFAKVVTIEAVTVLLCDTFILREW